MIDSNRHVPHSDDILQILFGKNISGVILPVKDYPDVLTDEEKELVTTASPKRQREFTTGRLCAKQALHIQDFARHSLLRHEARDPIWPDGVIGSISHCHDICGAVVANKTDYYSIGFDIEKIRQFRRDITDVICTEKEKEWINAHKTNNKNILTILLFSLKEAVYKCYFSFKRKHIYYSNLSIIPTLATNTATIESSNNDLASSIKLSFFIAKDYIFSGALWVKQV